MNKASALFAAGVACCLTGAATVALAQSPSPFQLRVPAQSDAADGTIQISVSYSLNLPLKSEEANDQAEALESGRRALYGIAAGECKVLMSTIASTCTLQRLNVQSNVRSQRGERQVYVNGNASYRIALKD